jgi:hypothetical protein
MEMAISNVLGGEKQIAWEEKAAARARFLLGSLFYDMKKALLTFLSIYNTKSQDSSQKSKILLHFDEIITFLIEDS